MAEDWDFFTSSVDDQPGQFFVDLSFRQSLPERRGHWLLCVVVTLNSPNAAGLSEPAEADELYAIEDALFAVLARTLRARYVGRLTTQGRREHFYYAPTTDGFESAVKPFPDRWPDRNWEFRTQHDPDWTVCRQVLLPGDFAWQTILTRRQVESLAAQGDDLTLPRRVAHQLAFPSMETRDQFVEQITGFGFAILEQPLGESTQSELPYAVELQRSDRVELVSLDGLVSDLFFRAENCGGSYLGWTCDSA